MGEWGYYAFSCKGDCDGVVAEQLNAKPGEMQKKQLNDLSPKHQKIHTDATPKKEHGLRYDKLDQFISETGQVFSITDLILKYEKLIRSQSEIKGEMTGRESTDVVYRLTKKGDKYTIDIFTGEDARKMLPVLKLD